MKTLKIFKKKETFFWSRSRIIGISFLLVFVLFGFKVLIIGKTANDYFEKITGYTICILMVVGLVNSLRNAQIAGTLDGFIKLKPDEICIENRKILLEEIRLIKIWAADYVGKQISATVGLWEIFSNGTDNRIVIILNSGETITRSFQMQCENEIIAAYKELEIYTMAGKMLKQNFNNLTR